MTIYLFIDLPFNEIVLLPNFPEGRREENRGIKLKLEGKAGLFREQLISCSSC